MAKENPMKQMKKKMYMDKYVYSGKHWSELKFYDHMMTDALIKHTLGLSRYGMSDAGEVFEVMGQTHTQMGCYASASERLFDWIEDHL